MPITSIEFRLTAAAAAKTTMTMTSRFASIANLEQVLDMGTHEGVALAIEQIDAILTTPTTL